MQNLTKLDKKIITLIEYNPRVTNKTLAKKCLVSKDTITYRLKKLEREGIILGYSAMIDYKKLGNFSFKLFLKLNFDTQIKEEFKAFLRTKKQVFALFDSFGNWNLAIAAFAKSQEEFTLLENDILEQFGEGIIERRFCSMVDAFLLQKDFMFFEKSEPLNDVSFWGETEYYSLDETDKKILKIIHENSRIPLTEISTKTNMSIDGIKYRLKKLQNKKIISTLFTAINYEKLGLNKYKMLIFPKKYSSKKEKEILTFLKNTMYTENIIRTIGPWKLEVELRARSIDDIEKVYSQLLENFPGAISDIEFSTLRNEELFAYKDLLLE